MCIERSRRDRLQHENKPRRSTSHRPAARASLLPPKKRDSSPPSSRRTDGSPPPVPVVLPVRSRRPSVDSYVPAGYPSASSGSDSLSSRQISGQYFSDPRPEYDSIVPAPVSSDTRPPGYLSGSLPKNGYGAFDETEGIRRRPEDLYEEASWDISLDTGTAYPCTQKDLNAWGGEYGRVAKRHSDSKLRAKLFSGPEQQVLVSPMEATLNICQHNAPGRPLSAQEHKAVDRLRMMIDDALQGSWGPDVAIKCFHDLDTVFFGGKLKGHVCITWSPPGEFNGWKGYARARYLGHHRVLIQMNAELIFLKPGHYYETPLRWTLACMLHEMWLVFNV